jgi:prepilin-type N-terminal cleavage/methylation domain-containing protein
MKKGFTIIELLIVITILAIISAVVLTSLSSINTSQAIDKDAQAIVAYLDQAKSNTLASKDASQYGVRFASTTITLFKGSTYNSSEPENRTYLLNPATIIKTVSLTGGGLDVVFSRLTGETAQNGTILVSSTRASTTRTVTIYKTGAIESN